MRRFAAMPEAVAKDFEPSVMPRRVLLVEDVEAMRLYLRYALERHGVQVLEAGDLETARQLLRSGPRPTSVLLDLELPDGNGLELLADVPHGAPVAALTGDGSSETARRCREAGCALVLSKSSKLGDIGEVLQKIERDWHAQPAPSRHEPELAERYLKYLTETLEEIAAGGLAQVPLPSPGGSVWFNAWHHQKEESLLAPLLKNILAQAVPPLWTRTGIEFRFRL